MNRALMVGAGAVLLAAVALMESAFIVPEGLEASIKGAHARWLTPGLHFKWPIGQSVQWRDLRPHLLVANGTEASPYVNVMTFDQKGLELGYAVLWRVSDSDLYAAQLTTDALAQSAIRAAVNQALSQCCLSQTLAQWLAPQSLTAILAQALSAANAALASKGLVLSQLSISALQVPASDRDLWLTGMKVRGQTALNTLQVETSTLAMNLKSAVDKKVSQTLVDGKNQAEKIRSQADAQATDIYAAAYRQNPDFYEFYTNLKAYQQVFKTRPPVMVVSTDSPFLKTLHGG